MAVTSTRASRKPNRDPGARPARGPSKRTVASLKPADEDAERMSSSDQIVAKIVRGLYEGTYVPGQKLTEVDLASKFGVGRGSVREALSRLAAEGLVKVSLHKGASIRSLSPEEVQDMLDVLEALTTASARLAAKRSTTEDHRTLRAMIASLVALASTGDVFEYGRMRNRLYRQIARIGGNKELSRLIHNSQAHLIRVQFRAAYAMKTDRNLLNDYKQIVQAIVEKDGAKAERAMRQHVRRTARAIESLSQDQSFGS